MLQLKASKVLSKEVYDMSTQPLAHENIKNYRPIPKTPLSEFGDWNMCVHYVPPCK